MDVPCSALEEIEKRSNELLGKVRAARFVDKGRDSVDVVKLVETLRDAVTRYQVSEDWFVASNTIYTAGQVSQQQAIYDRITDLTVRFFRSALNLYTDNRPCHQVFFQHPLEAPRGGADQWTCCDIH